MEERLAKLLMVMAGKSSRNRTFTDKICRWVITKASTPKPENDFLRDPEIDSDLGFDPDELERFQNGQ